MKFTKFVIAATAAVTLSGCGSLGFSAAGTTSVPTATVSGPTVTVAVPGPTVTAQPVVNATDLINQLTGPGAPFQKVANDLKVGDQVNLDAPMERGNAVFSAKSLKSQTDIKDFFASGTDQAKAARERVSKAIEEAVRKDKAAEVEAAVRNNPSYTDAAVKTEVDNRLNKLVEAEVSRALDGSGYFPLQVGVAAKILGTTYFKDGKVLTADGWRQVGKDDIFWMYMTSYQKIVIPATLRADCGNPDLVSVEPVNPENPEPPVECPLVIRPTGPGKYVWDAVTCEFKKVAQPWETQQNNNPAGSGQSVQTDRGGQAESKKQPKGVPSVAPKPQPTQNPGTGTGGSSTETGTNSGSNTGGTTETGTPGDAGGGDNDTEITCPFGGC